jgi:hypothetical protein
MSEGLDCNDYKSMLVFDRGSLNMAQGTHQLIKNLELQLSLAGASRAKDIVCRER